MIHVFVITMEQDQVLSFSLFKEGHPSNHVIATSSWPLPDQALCR